MLGHACSHSPLGVFCLVLLVVGDRLVVVHLDGCVQNAVVGLEVQSRRVTASESLLAVLRRRGQ